MSTSGGNEKTAVIASIAVMASGHRYRDNRRNLRVCKSFDKEIIPLNACVL